MISNDEPMSASSLWLARMLDRAYARGWFGQSSRERIESMHRAGLHPEQIFVGLGVVSKVEWLAFLQEMDGLPPWGREIEAVTWPVWLPVAFHDRMVEAGWMLLAHEDDRRLAIGGWRLEGSVAPAWLDEVRAYGGVPQLFRVLWSDVRPFIRMPSGSCGAWMRQWQHRYRHHDGSIMMDPFLSHTPAAWHPAIARKLVRDPHWSVDITPTALGPALSIRKNERHPFFAHPLTWNSPEPGAVCTWLIDDRSLQDDRSVFEEAVHAVMYGDSATVRAAQPPNAEERAFAAQAGIRLEVVRSESCPHGRAWTRLTV